MCGIAGFMRANTGGAADAAWAGRERMLERFADALAHRGPDGSGRYVDDHVAMVQTRLALPELPAPDAADALAIALTYAQSANSPIPDPSIKPV